MSPLAGRGLKPTRRNDTHENEIRSQGERGLKRHSWMLCRDSKVAPLVGAWIEISLHLRMRGDSSFYGAWIEICNKKKLS